MLIVLSPAKALDYETPSAISITTQPDFLDDSQLLINTLREKSINDIEALMDLSEKLAQLNVNRYQTWHRPFSAENAKQAVLAFNGDVYEGLNANTLTEKSLLVAQDHLRILSGLYGVLKPLDLMQPYRLEMGTKLVNTRGKNLYEFWANKITEYLNTTITQRGYSHLINLASDEYFKSVKPKQLSVPVIDCAFEDEKNGQYKIISFFAKHARGLMARHLIEKNTWTLDAIQSFNQHGYQFCEAVSTKQKFVFRRSAQS